METVVHPNATWSVYPLLKKEAFQEAQQAGIEFLHAQLLHNRGIDKPEEQKAFLHPDYNKTSDPFTLIDMPRAVERIKQALTSGEHITVYGDYDADGVTSSALLYRALRTLKQPDAVLDHHIPHRLRDGCGLNLTALQQLKERGTSLIITTDCASSDCEQVDYANSLGIDVIITDHHRPPLELPRAYAMVNPWRLDSSDSERYLCGAGIAFKLVQALYRTYQHPQADELDLLDLVAIGTIGDIAPLLGENHTLVKLGLQQLSHTSKPGLKALIRNANLQAKPIRERDIAYGIAPRINAAGRMKEASIAFALLTTDSDEEAQARVSELEQLNGARQQETEELMRNVREQAKLHPEYQVVLVSGDNWHEGIIGLVAGKLAEEISKPVLVLSNDPQTHLSRGSGRSQKGFNIIEALRSFPQHLERYGGHAQAAGFTIQSDRIKDLHEHLLQWQEHGAPTPAVQEGAEQTDQSDIVIEQENTPANGTQMVDIVFTKMDLNYSLYKSIRELSPFGAANPEPIFKIEGVRLLDKWSSGANGQNLRLRIGLGTNNMKIMGTLTRGATLLPSFDGISHVNIIFRLESSEDEVKQEVWLKILSVEPANKADALPG